MAKKTETNSFNAFRDSCLGVLKLLRIENLIGEGMPDVKGQNRSGASWWMELKAYDEWPARATTCILKNKFEKGQLGFMRAWKSWEGNAFVLLKVGRIYYLLDPNCDLPNYTRSQIVESAHAIGKEAVIEYLEKLS